MSLHLPSLYIAVAVALFIAAALSTTIVLRQRARRGSLWWIAGHVLLVGSLGLQAWGGRHDVAAPVAALLALQWPIAMLVGVRQFYSRGASSVPAWADAVVLAVAGLVACGTWLAPFESVSPDQVFAIAVLVVTLYAAAAVSRLEDFAVTSTLKMLVAGFAAAAAVQAMWLVVAVGVVPFAIAAADVGAAATLATAALALLSTQVTLAMNHERQIAHLRESQRKLRHLVDVDAVTRLPNRRHFLDLAERAVAPAPELATVLFFDVDQLKRINELLGHPNGDEALRQIGTALRETLRRRDVAGRLGGDEFGVVLPRTRVADAANVIARINARLEDRQIAPRIARVVLNVGITQMLAGETLADALRRAETGMTLQRDETRKLVSQKVAIVAEAATLRAREPRPSQLAALNAIPVGEVVLG